MYNIVNSAKESIVTRNPLAVAGGGGGRAGQDKHYEGHKETGMMVLQVIHMVELLKPYTLHTRRLLYVYNSSRKLVREPAIWNRPHPLDLTGWWGAQWGS